jgi:hypothetical protein
LVIPEIVSQESALLNISDCQGKNILRKNITEPNTLIQLGNIPQGLYFASIFKNGTCIATKSILLQY